MTKVEYWDWRYKNLRTGEMCRRVFRATAEDAATLFPGAQRMEGSSLLAEYQEPFDEVRRTPVRPWVQDRFT